MSDFNWPLNNFRTTLSSLFDELVEISHCYLHNVNFKLLNCMNHISIVSVRWANFVYRSRNTVYRVFIWNLLRVSWSISHSSHLEGSRKVEIFLSLMQLFCIMSMIIFWIDWSAKLRNRIIEVVGLYISKHKNSSVQMVYDSNL